MSKQNSEVRLALGNNSDWFYTMEYQQRGTPRLHMLI